MATESAAADLRERIELFVLRNFPQIAMHGGDAGVEGVDRETGEVWIVLAGACAGCGISPMTVQALESRLVTEFEEITTVHASTGYGFDNHRVDGDFSNVPF